MFASEGGGGRALEKQGEEGREGLPGKTGESRGWGGIVT